MCATYYAFGLFGKNAVDVDVKTCEVIAHQDQRAILECADVELRRGTRVETADVAEAYGRSVPLPGQYDCLKSSEDLAGAIAGESIAGSSTCLS